MTPISNRYGSILLVLFVAACGASWWSSGEDYREDDCTSPDVFRSLQLLEGTRNVKQRPEFTTGPRIQWTQGEVDRRSKRGTLSMTFRVLRTFDPYFLLVRPKALMPRGFSADWERVADVRSVGPDSPIRILFKAQGPEVGLIAYTYFYRGESVIGPFMAVFEAALRSFLEKTRPISVALVYGTAPKSEVALLEADAVAFLEAVRDHYRAACGPKS